MIVIIATVLLSHNEPPTWYWLLVIPVLLMQTLFNVGASFILARVGAGFDDVSQLLPFLVRTWFYLSGVMFSVQTFHTITNHPLLAKVLQLNPAAIYITLARNALMTTQREGLPGSKPSSARLCGVYHAYGTRWGTQRINGTILINNHHTAVNVVTNPALDSAYCHAVTTTTWLWAAGAGWAVAFLVAGFFFFWRAEVRYGRGG
jgi:teichoic acid transport system permease protein